MNRPFHSYAVVPAAGHSRRMGRSKLLLPWQGRPLLEHMLAAWHTGGVTAVFVVARRDDTELAAVVREAPAHLVTPPRDPREMKESVRYALQAIAERCRPTAADVWLLAPADMPTLHPASIRQLLDAHRPETPVTLVPQHRGRRGHPVLFPWSLAPEVNRLGADEGVNALLRRHPVREIATPDASVLHDVDTPDDYRRLGGSSDRMPLADTPPAASPEEPSADRSSPQHGARKRGC